MELLVRRRATDLNGFGVGESRSAMLSSSLRKHNPKLTEASQRARQCLQCVKALLHSLADTQGHVQLLRWADPKNSLNRSSHLFRCRALQSTYSVKAHEESEQYRGWPWTHRKEVAEAIRAEEKTSG